MAGEQYGGQTRLAQGGPTVREITTYLTQAKRDSEKWHKKIGKRRALYNLQHYSGSPLPGEIRFSDPTPQNVVDLFVGVMLANEIDWRAHGWSPSLLEERDSSHIEKYIQGVLETNIERTETNIVFDVIRDFGRDGAGILYSVWDPVIAEMAETTIQVPAQGGMSPQGEPGLKEIRAFTETPITLEAVDPTSIFLIAGGPRRWSKVFRLQQISVYDIEHLFGVSLMKYDRLNEQAKRQQKGTLIDYWCITNKVTTQPIGGQQQEQMPAAPLGEIPEDIEVKRSYVVQHALVFEDSIVWPLEDTPYPDIPFTIAFFKPVDRNKPEMWGDSILDPLVEPLKFMEFIVNRAMQQINVYTNLPLVAKALSSRKIDVDANIVDLVHLEPDEDLGFPTWPGNAPDFARREDFFQRRLQQSGFSDVMYGLGPSTVSGFALSQLSDQNRIRLEQPRQHLELLFSIWAKKVLKLTAIFAGDAAIRVSGRMRGRDFAEQVFSSDFGDYTIKARFKPEFPNDQVRNHAMGTQTAGVLSESTRMERYFNVDQPDEERKKRMQEAALNHPAMQQYAVITALLELAQDGDSGAALALQQLMAAGAGQGGPAGPGGPAPEAPLGLQSATGQPTAQAAGELPPGQGPEAELAAMSGREPGSLGGI